MPRSGRPAAAGPDGFRLRRRRSGNCDCGRAVTEAVTAPCLGRGTRGGMRVNARDVLKSAEFDPAIPVAGTNPTAPANVRGAVTSIDRAERHGGESWMATNSQETAQHLHDRWV